MKQPLCVVYVPMKHVYLEEGGVEACKKGRRKGRGENLNERCGDLRAHRHSSLHVSSDCT